MPNFLDNLAGKAQQALNTTPLGQQIASHIPGQQHAPQSGTTGAQPPPNAPSPTPSDHTTPYPTGIAHILKQHGLGGLQNSLRSLQTQYGSARDKPIQLLILGQKGLLFDYETVSRDSKTFSKELYIWGQEQTEEIKDVSDRLAYLNYVQGTLNSDLSSKIEASRVPFKTARNTETALVTKRSQWAGIEPQITRLRSEVSSGRAPPGAQAKLAELEQQRTALLNEVRSEDKNLNQQKLAALKQSEGIKWQAVREYAEKLILLSQAGEAFLDVLPAEPASPSNPYNGVAQTAAIRHQVQQLLDDFKPGNYPSPFAPKNDASKRSPSGGTSPDGFGVTHKAELSRTPSVADKIERDDAAPAPEQHTNPSEGVNPSNLNNTPAPIPLAHSQTSDTTKTSFTAVPAPGSGVLSSSGGSTVFSHQAAPSPHLYASPENLSGSGLPYVGATASDSSPSASFSHPTVAETGVPLTGDGAGPGPLSGSLRRNTSDDPPPGNDWAKPPNRSFKTAEDEKSRLEREERERLLRFGPQNAGQSTGNPSLPPFGGDQRHESAAEEKKRLEREERERVLRGGRSDHPQDDDTTGAPPAYDG